MFGVVEGSVGGSDGAMEGNGNRAALPVVGKTARSCGFFRVPALVLCSSSLFSFVIAVPCCYVYVLRPF